MDLRRLGYQYKKLFEVDIKISVANKTGVLAKVTSMLSDQGIGIENASAETGDSKYVRSNLSNFVS